MEERGLGDKEQKGSRGEARDLGGAALGVTVLSPAGVILYQSPSVERLLGYAPSERLGTSCLKFVHPDDESNLRALLGRCENLTQPTTLMTRVRHRDGSWRLIEAGIVTLPAVDTVPRVVFNWLDVTERLEMLEQLTNARKQASLLKNAFIANLGHQIRTPLNVILGHCEFLYDMLPAPRGDVERSLDAIAVATKQLSNVVQALFDLAQIESGAFRTNPTAVDLDQLIERQLAQFDTLAKRKGIGLTYERFLETPVALNLDEYCLSHALGNLIDNAIKFTEHGHVIVRLRHDFDGALLIDICDTGRGMGSEFLANLSEPFIQEGADGLRACKGCGLGLTLTRRYLALNGAQLAVKSVKSEGSVFSIRFVGMSAST